MSGQEAHPATMADAGDRIGQSNETDDGGYRPGYEVAAEQILEFIASNELHPGDRLPTEQELASILGVSRPVARDAIRTIAALGRVRVRKGAGIFVAEGVSPLNQGQLHLFLPADVDQVYMLFELRSTLECETSRLAASRATPLEVRAIQAAIEAAYAAARDDDYTAFRRADDDFHNSVARASHNMFFGSTVASVLALRKQVITLGLSNSGSGSLLQAADQHDKVGQAIVAGDGEAAAAAMGAHVAVAREQFRTAIADRFVTGDSSG